MTDELDYVQSELKSKVAPLNSTVMVSSPQKYYTHSTYTNLLSTPPIYGTLTLSKLIQEHYITNE